MKGKSLIAENRESACKKYCDCGGNVELTLRELKKEGLSLSKPTFYNWMEKFNFEERRKKIDIEMQKVNDLNLSFEDSMLKSLLDRKTAYEAYFEKSAEPTDHQAQYAYAGIIKTILDIKVRMGEFKSSLFIDFMKDLIGWLSKNDSEAVIAIEKNFDDFISFAKEKYAAK